METKATTGFREYGWRRRALVFCGHPVTGAGVEASTPGMPAIGVRTWAFMAESTMDSAMAESAFSAVTGLAALTTTTPL